MFQEIKQRLKIEDVIEFYHEKPHHKKYICPFHNDKIPSLSVNYNRQIFKCFVCEVGGDLITFTAKLFNLSNLDACKKLNDDFRLNLSIDKPDNKTSSEFLHRREQERKQDEHIFNFLNLVAGVHCQLRNEKKHTSLELILENLILEVNPLKQEDKRVFFKRYEKEMNELGRICNERRNTVTKILR